MRAAERKVYYFDLTVKKLGKSTVVPNLTEIVEVWNEYYQADKAYQSRQKGNVIYKIEDLSYSDDGKLLKMLVSVIDKGLPDAAYGNLDDRKTRILKKGVRDGGSISAHVVISMRPNKDKVDTYACMIEGVRRLSAANIQYLWNSLLREEYGVRKDRFTFPDPGGVKTRQGNIKRHSYLPLIGLGGQPSKEFLEDIENGILRTVNLVETRQNAQFGKDPYLVEQAYQLTIGVKPDIPPGNRWDRIKAAVRAQKGDYTKGRIVFLDPENNTRSIDFDVESESLDNQKYIKYKMITNIDPPLADASDKIVDHFCDRVIAMLHRELDE